MTDYGYFILSLWKSFSVGTPVIKIDIIKYSIFSDFVMKDSIGEIVVASYSVIVRV